MYENAYAYVSISVLVCVGIVMWGSVEKFIGWPRYSLGMWPNEIDFSA